jgi:hypothetical protein
MSRIQAPRAARRARRARQAPRRPRRALRPRPRRQAPPPAPPASARAPAARRAARTPAAARPTTSRPSCAPTPRCCGPSAGTSSRARGRRARWRWWVWGASRVEGALRRGRLGRCSSAGKEAARGRRAPRRGPPAARSACRTHAPAPNPAPQVTWEGEDSDGAVGGPGGGAGVGRAAAASQCQPAATAAPGASASPRSSGISLGGGAGGPPVGWLRLRSLHSRRRCVVRFVNRTPLTARVLWLTFQGDEVGGGLRGVGAGVGCAWGAWRGRAGKGCSGQARGGPGTLSPRPPLLVRPPTAHSRSDPPPHNTPPVRLRVDRARRRGRAQLLRDPPMGRARRRDRRAARARRALRVGVPRARAGGGGNRAAAPRVDGGCSQGGPWGARGRACMQHTIQRTCCSRVRCVGCSLLRHSPLSPAHA